MNEEPKKKQEEETGEEGKLQPWTLHDYTIKSYVQSKREREREEPRSKRKNKTEKEREGCRETEGSGKGRDEKKTKRDQGGWKASRTVSRGLFVIVCYRDRRRWKVYS